MRKMKIKRIEMHPERHRALNIQETEEAVRENLDARQNFINLSEKYKADRNKLDDAILRVEASRISDEDKKEMIAELNDAIEQLKTQYANDAVETLESLDERAEELFAAIDRTTEELEKHKDRFDNLGLEAAYADATAVAATVAEKKKTAFESIKSEYSEALVNKLLKMSEIERMIMEGDNQ